MTVSEGAAWLLGTMLISSFFLLQAAGDAEAANGLARFQEELLVERAATEGPQAITRPVLLKIRDTTSVVAVLRIPRLELEVPERNGTEQSTLSGGPA